MTGRYVRWSALPAALVLGVVLHLLGADAVSLVLGLLLVAAILPGRLGPAGRLVCAGSVVYSGGTVLGFLPLVGLRMTATVVGLAALLAPAAALALGAGRLPDRAARRRLLDPAELMSLLTVAVTTCWLAWPGLDSTVAQQASLLTAGEDNSSHLLLIQSVHQNGGFLYFQLADWGQRILPGFLSYPQGWHVNVAAVELLRHGPGLVAPQTAVHTYYLAMFATLAWLLLAAATAAIALARRTARERAAMLVLAPLLVLGLAVSPLFTLVVFGYQPQVAGTALVLALLVLCLQGRGAAPRATFALGALLVQAVAQTWYLLALAAAGALVVWAWPRRRQILRGRLGWLTAAATAGLAGLALVPGLAGLQTAAYTALGDGGGAVGPPIPITVLMAVVVLMLVVGDIRQQRLDRRSAVAEKSDVAEKSAAVDKSAAAADSAAWPGTAAPLGGAIVAAGLTTGAVAAYQLIAFGGTSYYFTKLLVEVWVFALVGLVPLAVRLATAATTSGRQWVRVASPVLAAALVAIIWAAGVLPVVGRPKAMTQWRAGDFRRVAPDNFSQLWAAGRARPERPVIFFAASGSSSTDYLSSRFAGAFASYYPTSLHQQMLAGLQGRSLVTMAEYLQTLPSGAVVVTADPLLPGRLRRNGMSSAKVQRLHFVLLKTGPQPSAGPPVTQRPTALPRSWSAA